MDINNLKDLLSSGKIDKSQYTTYLLFEANEVGRDYLKFMCESVLMEEPLNLITDNCAWHDGRRSVWRHIKLMIYFVENALKETKNDGSIPANSKPAASRKYKSASIQRGGRE